MLTSLTIKMRLQIGFTAILILAVGAITPILLYKANAAINAASDIQLNELFSNMELQLEDQARLAQELSTFVADMPVVQQAFAEGNRDALTNLLSEPFKQLKAQYGVLQLQFHTPPAISFLRIHKLNKYGDDLSDFRKTVLETNRNKRPVRGLEVGVAGLGMRGLVPVSYQGNHIGSLEFGLSFGQSFFDQFKQKHGVEIQMHLYEDGRFKTFASTLQQSLFSDALLKQAFDGNVVKLKQVFNGKQVAMMAKQVLDYSGTSIGVVAIAFDETYYQDLLNSARNSALMLAGGIFFVGILLSLIIASTIVKPIETTTASLLEIAHGEGDLSARLPVLGDNELSHMGDAFNLFSAKIQQTIALVQDSIIKLSHMAENLATSSADTRMAAANQAKETEQVAAALNEMTNSFQSVAKSAFSAASAAKEANQQAQTGNGVVQRSIQAINSLAAEVEQSAETIQGLETQSKQIGGILETIRNIAEQTNLLALNAAIEAARAGEQGRGFAVVADEVRTLASRTQLATQEIQSMITGLQLSAKTAVESMQASQAQMKVSISESEQAGAAFHSITQAVATISTMNEQIAKSSEQQTSVAENINRNEVRISDASRQAVQAAENIAKSSETLAQLAENLELLLGKFKV